VTNTFSRSQRYRIKATLELVQRSPAMESGNKAVPLLSHPSHSCYKSVNGPWPVTSRQPPTNSQDRVGIFLVLCRNCLTYRGVYGRLRCRKRLQSLSPHAVLVNPVAEPMST
jgi:hypothetical protein